MSASTWPGPKRRLSPRQAAILNQRECADCGVPLGAARKLESWLADGFRMLFVECGCGRREAVKYPERRG